MIAVAERAGFVDVDLGSGRVTLRADNMVK
jgi:hypothetical protein